MIIMLAPLVDLILASYMPANDESLEAFDIIKPGRRVKIKGHRQ